MAAFRSIYIPATLSWAPNCQQKDKSYQRRRRPGEVVAFATTRRPFFISQLLILYFPHPFLICLVDGCRQMIFFSAFLPSFLPLFTFSVPPSSASCSREACAWARIRAQPEARRWLTKIARKSTTWPTTYTAAVQVPRQILKRPPK